MTTITLSNKEQQVLDYLASGFTQKEVGYEMKCSQAYGSKFIHEKIMPKFHMQHHSVKILINLALASGIVNFIAR